ncbi:metal ABC transporter ATP-binding protein [Fructilactobacillus frigidiflavus]|uniref:metal ABC transporter ATP-binding protein n=1 Tax=Fructilactobacillus frigidiflavus TaxID=3242688 RepID=UPI0037580671
MAKISINAEKIGYLSEKKTVLSDVNIKLNSGNIYALIGSNGAGKSTLINTMIGVLNPIEGKVSIEINEIKQPYFSKIGFCPQFPLVDWYTKVFDNVLLGPLLAGKSLSESRKNSNHFLNLLGIISLKKKAMDHISGGQQQRVQLARELAKDPDIYILDEPTTGLDVETSEKLFKFLKEKAELGKLILISSHDLTLIEEYANKVLFIDQGRVKFNGEMADFINTNDSSSEIRITIAEQEFEDAVLNDLKNYQIISDNTISVSNHDLIKTIDGIKQNKQNIIKIETVQPSLRDRYLTLKNKEK